MMEYKYTVSGCTHFLYPIETHSGVLCLGNSAILQIPKLYPFRGEWGTPNSNIVLKQEKQPMPFRLELVWLSVAECVCYSIAHDLPTDRLEVMYSQYGEDTFTHMLLGMAPNGGLTIWITGYKKAIIISTMHASKCQISFREFTKDSSIHSMREYCSLYINQVSKVHENLINYGLPPREIFDNYMKQFTYRYLPLFEHRDEDKNEWQKYEKEKTLPKFDYIEEALFDGTHDKLHDGGLMQYHQAGKPKKLAVKWHIKKSEYMAYFWFEDEEICKAFDRFYGAHPETKTDFMIRIDAEHNKYELALYRYGLKEPQVINESAYQLLVFKNKFEYYRSANYNQPRGAWIW